MLALSTPLMGRFAHATLAFSTLGLAALTLTATSCAAGDDAGRGLVTIRDSAGLAIFEFHGADRALENDVVPLTALTSPDSALSPVPWGIVADPRTGRIYIADRGGTRISIFDTAGAYAGELGRAGGGPGEFRHVVALALDPEGALAAWDVGRGVLSRWSPEGTLIDERRTELDYWGPGFLLGHDRVVAVTSSGSSGMKTEQSLVALTPAGTTTLYDLPLELSLMRLPCATMPAPRIFAPQLIWTGRGDTTYVLHAPEYRIDVHLRDTLLRSLRRAVSPIRVTGALAEAAVVSGPGPYGSFLRRCGVTAAQLAAAVGHEPETAPVQGLALDPAGRLWVARTTTGLAPESVDILDPTNGYLGTLALPAIPAAFLSESRFIGVSVHETGEVVAMLYEVEGIAELAAGRGRELGAAGSAWPTGTAGDGASRAGDGLSPRADVDAAGAGRREPAGPGEHGGGRSGADPAHPGEAAHTPSYSMVPGLREFRDCPVCPLMVQLPPGRFLMGAPEGEEPASRNPNRPEWTELAEKPQVEVEIAYPLAVGKYEVTFAEWDHCVAAGGCTHIPDDNGWGRGDRPVINVSRDDAEEYIRWLTQLTGQPYRLPTEAEWEYAARGGTTTARYWGDQIGRGMAICDRCGSRWDKRSTVPVGTFPPNPFGLHEMLDNVTEWVADCWNPDHTGARTDGSARIEDSPWWRNGRCERPMQRGGAWGYFTWTVRAAKRSYFSPCCSITGKPWNPRGDSRGFRVARTAEPRAPTP
jgi:formylglycine-generating enzyme required for sulfatase activity